jgi:hypothetical protein
MTMSALLKQLDGIGNPYELWDAFPAIMRHIAELEAKVERLQAALEESCKCGEFGHIERCPACTALLAETQGE